MSFSSWILIRVKKGERLYLTQVTLIDTSAWPGYFKVIDFHTGRYFVELYPTTQTDDRYVFITCIVVGLAVF